MYKWRTNPSLILMLICALGQAADWQCMSDIDDDGQMTTEGEVAACVSTLDGPLCPIDSDACTQDTVCPLDSDRTCVAGECSIGGTCSPVGLFSDWGFPITVFECDHTGSTHLAEESCKDACVRTEQCVSGPPVCPFAGGVCKQDSAGGFSCSKQECFDLDVNHPVVTEINSGIYKDDGRRDDSGMCLDQIMIYSGRAMECRLAGKSTAYNSCCKGFDKIMTDSTGSIIEMAFVGSSIYGASIGTKAAFDAYKAGESLSQVTGGFSAAFKTAFDPVSLAISIGVSFALDYFLNNCNEMDMETGILNASGMCYETGEYCKSEWLGDCVQKAKTYCCFNSKLGRLIHEGGRPQLQSFSDVPPTDCRGFYPEEFQYLDFSNIDLNDYYGDISARPQKEVEIKLNNELDESLKTLD